MNGPAMKKRQLSLPVQAIVATTKEREGDEVLIRHKNGSAWAFRLHEVDKRRGVIVLSNSFVGNREFWLLDDEKKGRQRGQPCKPRKMPFWFLDHGTLDRIYAGAGIERVTMTEKK